ncbi:histidinol phosphate aminotransferase [Novosphingobium sp. PC22D]|uniref:pyridoxal phosphate-dependent aminotransferase n=1 Tax=Novosphingobium sp. PC22D TaxID=1962403 RepID=UPI000BFAF178|nr:histidinol-phosphate transaminase [Novosphingobium sp. PC22D]PEQ13872.1 histidinol phosphate aminotransferase [Novosphingobium sp. PC22D]
MDINRRVFMAGTAAATGLIAGGPGRAVEKPAGASDYFGPGPGEALLSRNENPYGPAPSALSAISQCASKGCYYADKGVEKLSAMIAERHGVRKEQVVLGSGSTEILCAVALAWGRSGMIVCPDLFWDTTVLYGERQGAKSLRVPLKADMNVDLAAMDAATGEGVSLVHICNPNNPTGMLVDPAGMRTFAERITPKATLLVDEAYNELTDNPAANTVVDLVKEGKDIIVCRTFSKIYGMAGMRVGYAITSEKNAARIRGYLMSFGGNVSGLAAAIGSYDDAGFLERSKAMVREGREMILAAVKSAGLTALPCETNFVFVEVPDADAVKAAMAQRGIAIRGAYGTWKQYSRVSTGKLEDVRRYAEALPQVIDGLRG